MPEDLARMFPLEPPDALKKRGGRPLPVINAPAMSEKNPAVI
jgi:hypothetical protein